MPGGTSGTERTIGQLVADATHDLQGIVRGEIALAKAEVTSGAKVFGQGVGLLVGAGFLAFMAVVFLLHSAAWAISLVLPVWAGYAIVAVVILIIAVVLGLLGRRSLQNAQPAPERAIDQAQQTIDAILGSRDDDGPAAGTGGTSTDAGAGVDAGRTASTATGGSATGGSAAVPPPTPSA